jgi:hypothetical protein
MSLFESLLKAMRPQGVAIKHAPEGWWRSVTDLVTALQLMLMPAHIEKGTMQVYQDRQRQQHRTNQRLLQQK